MAATRLTSTPVHDIPQYAVVGNYLPGGTLVLHVGLLRSNMAELRKREAVAVWEIGTSGLLTGEITLEMARGRRGQGKPIGQIKAQVVGFLRPLTPKQREGIKTTLYRLDREPQVDSKEQVGFIVRPHCEVVRDHNGCHLYNRFSCAGYILECYSGGCIDFLDLDNPGFPEVDLKTLKKTYPSNAIDDPKTRDRLGIPGTGPWDGIVFPGYIMHSLDRVRSRWGQVVPYLPASPVEANFPLPINKRPLSRDERILS